MNVIERIERGETTVSIGINNTNTTPEQIQASAELLRLARLGQSMQWVSVNERLPEIDYSKPEYSRYVSVFAVNERGLIGILRYASNGHAKTEKGRLPRWEGTTGRIWDGEVTHWMLITALPLPLPPAPGKDGVK